MNTLKALEKFMESTDKIQSEICNLQVNRILTGEIPSKELLLDRFNKFCDIARQGEKDGVKDLYYSFFYLQGRNVIDAFKFFEDIIPDFKKL